MVVLPSLSDLLDNKQAMVVTASLPFPPAVCSREKPVAPVAYQVIFEPGRGQFREFESPRVHTRNNSWGLFLVHKWTCGKRGSVS